MDAYSDRLKKAMHDAGVSVTQLAAAVGVTYQGVKKVIDGGSFGSANNAKAAAYLNVSGDWLATGGGAMRGEPPAAAGDPEDFYWLLSQIPDPLRRRLAAHEAIAVVLRAMREPDVPPTHTPAVIVSPGKRRA